MKKILRFLVILMLISVGFILGGIDTGAIDLLTGFAGCIAIIFLAGLIALGVK